MDSGVVRTSGFTAENYSSVWPSVDHEFNHIRQLMAKAKSKGHNGLAEGLIILWCGALLKMFRQITAAVKDAHYADTVFENTVKNHVRT